MEIDDLKRSWEEQSRKLDAVLRLNTSLLRESALKKASTATARLSWLLMAEILLDLVLCVWLGSFNADHVTEPRFLVPGIVLHLYAIGAMILGIHQWLALKRVDYGAPVLEIQKRLGALRVQRVRATKLILLSVLPLWTPLLIVALKGLLGVDAYAIFSSSWLAANVAFGAAVIPLAVWISKRYADRMERSPLVQRLMRDLAGYNVNAATDFVSSLVRFEEEEQESLA
jgi:hypothetical protein